MVIGGFITIGVGLGWNIYITVIDEKKFKGMPFLFSILLMGIGGASVGVGALLTP